MAAKNVWTLNETERKACTLLSKMKSTNNVWFDKCWENDQIYLQAMELLGGADPIEFAVDVLTGLYGECSRDYYRKMYEYYLL